MPYGERKSQHAKPKRNERVPFCVHSPTTVESDTRGRKHDDSPERIHESCLCANLPLRCYPVAASFDPVVPTPYRGKRTVWI